MISLVTITVIIDGVKVTLEGSFFDIVQFLKRVLSYVPEPAVSITFLHEGKDITMVQMTETQQMTGITLKISKKNGQPGTLDGPAAWSSSDTAVAVVQNVAADGLSGEIKAVAPGVCQIKVEGDADLGPGTRPLVGFLDVTITGDEATVIELIPGQISDQP